MHTQRRLQLIEGVRIEQILLEMNKYEIEEATCKTENSAVGDRQNPEGLLSQLPVNLDRHLKRSLHQIHQGLYL